MYLKELIKFFRIDLTNEDYLAIADTVRRENYMSLKTLAFLTILFTFVMSVVSYAAHDPISITILHVSLMLIAGLFLLFITHYKKNSHQLIIAEIHIFCALLLFYAIILSTYLNHDHPAVSFVAIILALPLFFTDKPKHMALFICFFALLFLVFSFLFDDRDVLLFDCVNGIIFPLISIIVSSYMMKVKYQNIYLKLKYQHLSENDVLTDLRNRNSFEQILESKNYHPAYCIYIDVNGLHELNNKEGHMAGDEMLKYVARILAEYFEKAHCFRVGGDEFVAFLFHDDDKLQETITAIHHQAALKNYHLSLGYSKMTENKELKLLVKEAESMMYEEKMRYYQNNTSRQVR